MGWNIVSQKVHFSGSKLTCNSKPLVYESSPDFFHQTQEELPLFVSRPILDILSRSGDIRDQRLKRSKIDRNFACFWPQIFWGRAPLEFLEWDYKIQPDSDHVAKFPGDRSRDLGERVAKKDNITGKT